MIETELEFAPEQATDGKASYFDSPRECYRFERDLKPVKELPLWREAFSVLELAILHFAPVYFGLGCPKGDGSAVILLPGFLTTDAFLAEMYAWLYRLDYKPYFSGIGLNAECPNLLIRRRLNAAIDRARRETGRKVHLIGHSLGGVIAMSVGAQRPQDIASVITLGSPFRGAAANPNILRMAEIVRKSIQARHAAKVLPNCYTGRCTCNFIDSLERRLPNGVGMTAIYSKTDGIVDWKYCVTGDSETDVEAPGTHIGMIVNPSVYAIIARRLAQARVYAGQAQSPVA